MKLSAVVITNRQEINPLLLKSLAFADEIIIVLDSVRVIPAKAGIHSIAQQNKKTKTFYHPLNLDFSAQRNFALQKAKSDWVLFVDDDEYVGTELGGEIGEAIQNNSYAGYLIRRQDVVYHQPLLHGETGNIKILRLAKRHAGVFRRPVHETWQINGRVGELNSPLYHIKDHFVSEFTSRMALYGQIDSKILVYEQKPFSWFRLFFYPLAKFKLNFIFKAGFLDGTAGLFLAYLLAVQSLSVRIFQWQSQN